MAKRWTKKEVIELLDTMSLEELEILWRELRRCWAPTGANLWRIRRRRGKRAFEGTLFQIPKPSPYRSYANKRIDVHVLLDGAVEFFYQNQKIARFDSKKMATPPA